MRILVVDDEKLLVKGVKFNLENEGYEVECAYDGASAVELARNGRFDLIILDVMMPDPHTGLLPVQLRHHHIHVDNIILTSLRISEYFKCFFSVSCFSNIQVLFFQYCMGDLHIDGIIFNKKHTLS